MRTRERNVWLLILGISGLSGLAWFMNTYEPDSTLRIIEFFSIFLISSFLISQYLLNNVRRAILFSIGFSIVLILRLLNLRDPIYVLLLLASLVSLEALFSKH